MAYLLSVCIPTWNRREYLIESMECFITCIVNGGFEDRVEIVISDNASVDDTEQVVREYMAKYPFINFYTNEKNIRDMNFYRAAMRGQGKYIWVFGDDDEPDAVTFPKLIDLLERDYELYILNFSFWDADLKSPLKPRRYTYDEQLIKDKNDVLGKFGIGLQFLSGNIFKKTVFSSCGEEGFAEYAKEHNGQCYAIYQGLSVPTSTYFIAGNCLNYRGNNSETSFDDWYRIFVTGNFNLVMDLKRHNYSWLSRYRATGKIISEYLMKDVVQRKLKNVPARVILGRIPSFFFLFPLYSFLILPMIIFPNKIFQAVYLAYKGKKAANV